MATFEEVIRMFDALASEKALQAATLGALALQKRRIYEQGLNAAGGKIGTYSTKETYFNPKDSPVAFAPKGKRGATKFKSGKPHVTRYFESGYKGVRAAAGRRTDSVNFDFTGQLRFSHTMSVSGNKAYIGFDSRREGLKAQGLEERFGNVYDLSQEEIDAVGTILLNEAFGR